MSPPDKGQSEPEPEPVRGGREALDRSVAGFADPVRPWFLMVQCAGNCAVQRRPVADLAAHLPPGLLWREVLARLRCGRCGEDADIVGLSGPPKTAGGGAVWLLLQGSKGQWRR